MSLLEKFGFGRGRKNTEPSEQGLMSEISVDAEAVESTTDRVRSVENKLWRREESQGIYSFPVPELDNSLAIGQELAKKDPPEKVTEQIGPFLISRSPESHQTAQSEALDFLVPDGTPVLAAQDGEIVRFVMNYTEWGPSREFADRMNFITIIHSDGEQTQYCHLAFDSLSDVIRERIRMKQELRVAKGQEIAVTGKTGWTDRDHLHFIVFREEDHEIIDGQRVENPEGYKSLMPKFAEEADDLNI